MSVVNDPALHEYPLEDRINFDRFHRENPHVFGTFKQRAFAMRATGRLKYGARTIIENMRWDYDIATTGDVFLINDDYVPMYARLFLHRNPKMLQPIPFFELRRVRSRGRMSDEERERRGL
jgi:hypothetical protein